MKKTSVELKVGVFVFAALVILGSLVFKAGDFYLKPGYTVRFLFDFVSGVDSGSPVRVAGVNVGEVKAIHVIRAADGSTHVEAIAWIAQRVAIEEDADARINSLGILSEKYIEVIPGTPGSPTLKNGGFLKGKSPIAFSQLTESGGRLIEKMEYAVDNLNNVIADPSFQTDVKGTFSGAAKVSRNLLETTEDLKDAAKSARLILGKLKDGQGTVGRLFMDDTIAKDLEAFVKDLKAHPWKLLKKN